MGFHAHLKLIRRCPSQPFQENLHTILTPEHKEQLSLRISPFVIFSTSKRQVGLCKLCPFLLVTKQSWFTDLNHSYWLAATRAAAIEKRFPKILPLESVLQEKLSGCPETRGYLECRYIWRTETAARPSVTNLSTIPPFGLNRHTHTRL